MEAGPPRVKNRGGVPVAFSLHICIVFSLRQSSAYLTPASVRCAIERAGPQTCFYLHTHLEVWRHTLTHTHTHTAHCFKRSLYTKKNQDTDLVALSLFLSFSLSLSLSLYLSLFHLGS